MRTLIAVLLLALWAITAPADAQDIRTRELGVHLLGNAYFQQIITKRCAEEYLMTSRQEEKATALATEIEREVIAKHPNIRTGDLYRQAANERIAIIHDVCKASPLLMEGIYRQVFGRGPATERKDFGIQKPD